MARSRKSYFSMRKKGRFVIVGSGATRFYTLAQAQKKLYSGNLFGSEHAIAHVVEEYRRLQGDARPFHETPQTRIRRLVNSKLDPLYARRKAWMTKLKRAQTALRRLQRRISWYERHSP